MATIEKLNQMQATIQANTDSKTRLEGQLQEQMNQLARLGFGDLVAAKIALKADRATLDKLDGQVDEGISQLVRDYGL